MIISLFVIISVLLLFFAKTTDDCFAANQIVRLSIVHFLTVLTVQIIRRWGKSKIAISSFGLILCVFYLLDRNALFTFLSPRSQIVLFNLNKFILFWKKCSCIRLCLLELPSVILNLEGQPFLTFFNLKAFAFIWKDGVLFFCVYLTCHFLFTIWGPGINLCLCVKRAII